VARGCRHCPQCGRARPGDELAEAVVSDLEIERKESLTRQEAAKRLMVITEALAGGDEVELDLGDTSLSFRVADELRVEVEVDGDEYELELELKWSLGALPRRLRRPRRVRRSSARGSGRRNPADPVRH
jgi:amphi-Trp domain-containing protein